jgi:hypothetical protein
MHLCNWLHGRRQARTKDSRRSHEQQQAAENGESLQERHEGLRQGQVALSFSLGPG